jgi:hypothetical protein
MMDAGGIRYHRRASTPTPERQYQRQYPKLVMEAVSNIRSLSIARFPGESKRTPQNSGALPSISGGFLRFVLRLPRPLREDGAEAIGGKLAGIGLRCIPGGALTWKQNLPKDCGT